MLLTSSVPGTGVRVAALRRSLVRRSIRSAQVKAYDDRWRQGIVLTRRSSLQKEPMPCGPMPFLVQLWVNAVWPWPHPQSPIVASGSGAGARSRGSERVEQHRNARARIGARRYRSVTTEAYNGLQLIMRKIAAWKARVERPWGAQERFKRGFEVGAKSAPKLQPLPPLPLSNPCVDTGWRRLNNILLQFRGN